MSLVNDMLRDLNKRTPVSNQAARVHGAIHSSIESKRPKVRTGVFLAGGLLAGLAGGYFYFESMGVQVIQVPMATVPVQIRTNPSEQNLVPVPSPTTAAVPGDASARAEANANIPAIETLVEIRELAMQPNGFTLVVEASQETTFDIRDRSAFGLTVHIDGIDRYDRAATTVPGMSLLLVSDGLDIGLELNEPTDFLVREDTETPEFDILITASYRPSEALTATETPAPQPAERTTPAVATISNPSVPESGTAVSSSTRAAPVRINRELSLEDRDRNNSQDALVLVQGGRMAEAYEQLLAFLEQNPAAHQSRETLAKLLLAQQEFVQAGTVIDQGLDEVPNYAPFKKIKARLLMQNNETAPALALLRSAPPTVAADTEYHELLASLYQKSDLHQQAVATYQDLLRRDRTQGRWWTGLAISLQAQGMGSDALASYQAALQTANLDANLRQFVQARIRDLGNPQ